MRWLPAGKDAMLQRGRRIRTNKDLRSNQAVKVYVEERAKWLSKTTGRSGRPYTPFLGSRSSERGAFVDICSAFPTKGGAA